MNCFRVFESISSKSYVKSPDYSIKFCKFSTLIIGSKIINNINGTYLAAIPRQYNKLYLINAIS